MVKMDSRSLTELKEAFICDVCSIRKCTNTDQEFTNQEVTQCLSGKCEALRQSHHNDIVMADIRLCLDKKEHCEPVWPSGNALGW